MARPRVVILAAALVLAAGPPAAGPAGAQGSLSAMADDQPVRALVSGWQPFTDMPVGADARRQALAALAVSSQDGVAEALAADGAAPATARRFRFLPVSAVTTTAGALRAFQAAHPSVDVRPDAEERTTLNDTDRITGAVESWRMGVTGKGVYVAVLDTGVDAHHPFLAGRVVEEACFAIACPNGQSQMTGPGAAKPVADHGTHVAGIVAGHNDKFAGIAPEARIIGVRVFSANGKQVSARTSDVLAGLDYVIGLALDRKLPIAAVNLSLGHGRFGEPCADDPAEVAAKALLAAGILMVASAGNDGDTTGIGSPACAPHAVSVGALDKQGAIASFSDSAPFLTVLAPGVKVLSSLPGSGNYGALSGTSMAAPHIAGALALLRQANPDMAPEDLLHTLLGNAPVFADPRNGVRTPVLRLQTALAVPKPLPPQPVPQPAPQPLPQPAPLPQPVRVPSPAPAPAPAPVLSPAPLPPPRVAEPPPPAQQPASGWGAITQ